MNKRYKMVIQDELLLYTVKQSKLLMVSIQELLQNKNLLVDAVFLYCVGAALESMPVEARAYLRHRCFDGSGDKVICMALDMGLSERTARRWYRLFLQRIAEQLQIFKG